MSSIKVSVHVLIIISPDQSKLIKLYFFQDGEHCLDRLYGGYFPDWSCGGQWNNMMAFLTTLFTNYRFQMMYADSYMTKTEFEEMFDHTLYFEMRQKYDCLKAFPSVYEKVNKAARAGKAT